MGEKETIILIIASLIAILLLCIAFIVILLIHRNRKLLYAKETHELYETHQQELLTSQLEIQQQTMQHIGREIHDNVGQKLTLASLYTQQLEFTNQYPVINEQLVAIGSVINESLTELRSLSKSLTDANTLNISLQKLIQTECKKIDATGNCKTHFSSNETETNINPSTKNIVLRMVQEFLQNSLKHSQCKLITIQLNNTAAGIILFLKDDGKGFNTNQPAKGIGLQNIAKRAATLNAQLTLQSTIGKGTSLKLLIPTVV